jgi:hypothetical protein
MDDQRTNREGGGLEEDQPAYAMRGFRNTIRATTLIGIVCATALCFSTYLHPSIAGKAREPLTLKEVFVNGFIAGAAIGLAAGTVCGLGVAAVRMAKK